MGCISPFRLNLYLKNTHKVNGKITSGYRFQFTTIRGISAQFYSCQNFGFGRSIVANSARESCKYPCNILVSRAIGLIDTIQYLALLPLLLFINLFCFIGFVIVGLATLPFLICWTEKIKKIQIVTWVGACTLPLTLLLNIIGIVFVPLQIIAPELLAALYFDRWDTGFEEQDIL